MEKIISDFTNYKITSDGIVLSKRKGYRRGTTWVKEENWKPIKSVLDKGVGYYLVTLIAYTEEGTRVKKNQFIHRLLGQAFIPNPEGKAHINHIDGVKTNNSLSNLEWATEQENSQHAVDNKLTTYECIEKPVCQYDATGNLVATYKSAREAYNQTSIAYQNISKVLRGKRNTAGGYSWKYKESSETNHHTVK